jgi:phage pi2 protein 07
MGQAVLETLEPVEEIQGFESVEVSSPAGENGTDDSSHTNDNLTSNPYSIHGHDNDRTDNVSFTLTQVDGNNDVENEDDNSKRKFDSDLDDLNGKKTTKTYSSDNYIDNRGKILSSTEISNSANEFALNDPANKDKAYSQVSSNDYRGNLSNSNDGMIRKTIRKPILKKTFTLKKIGYKVIPYEDETDPRYSFTNENIVFVNKAHSTYKVEAQRGDEFLFRHITNIVAEVVVGSKYPEAKDILEIQNKLISEAIKIHDYSMLKK